MNSTASYKVLLGRDWIHANMCVPSSLHQCLLFWHNDKVEMVRADGNPFKAEVHYVDACYYHEDIQPISFGGLDRESQPTTLRYLEDKVFHIIKNASRRVMKHIVPYTRPRCFPAIQEIND